MREQLVERGVADFPPSYDELFEKTMNEDYDSLPSYEVACETETQASNDGNDTPSIGETEDDTVSKDKTETENEPKDILLV